MNNIIPGGIEMNKSPSKYFVFLGLFFTSTSSIFVRSIDAPSLTIASYRLLAGTLFMMVPFLRNWSRKGTTLDREGFFLSVVSGIFLAGHFATWISSLEYTTVSSSTVLVALSPIFVAFFNFIVLKERLKRIQTIGILVSIAGAVIISAGDIAVSGEALFGDFLAFMGAVFVAGYLLIGKKVRKYLTLSDYAFVTYASAAVTLFVLAVIMKTDLSPGGPTQLSVMFLHGIICSGLGHTTYNWMLQHVSSTYVSTVTLGEPVFASILAFLILRETPSLQTVAGGMIVIAGLYVFVKSPDLSGMISGKKYEKTN
ncbi:Permease of the drug/metabolite transporter (DMT) superfamily [Dethiosulfatibacter aminovorans DSM 17477]|uniref:Permease of the drug/metabolite transporter (DMT) superfamily n=1 Tax=Dethiosulfatibacter aminovorans DSM 17477 TaxID=1121476 RepID=A0A1M6K391_9FIRM|nr:DMT family transporter [Dethiosulfatibacter aminovorans]SHJ53355.1 Permease of the drug/metabolite transporter (DMT) superfamily [Dethiosulfatibacter aminovorans DSM 17477]